MLPGSVETSTDVVAAAVFADASAGATTGYLRPLFSHRRRHGKSWVSLLNSSARRGLSLTCNFGPRLDLHGVTVSSSGGKIIF
jgi:hypothetical protein